MLRDRAHARKQVSIEAKVLSPDLSECVDCIVNDVSEGGALISLRSDARVPDRIYLWQARTQTSLECEVRWRRLNLVGLKFIAPESVEARALMKVCSPPVVVLPLMHKSA